MEKANDTETCIFLLNRNIVKVVLSFGKRTCHVYSDKGKLLMIREKMSPIDMIMLKRQITNYIKDGKKLRGFGTFGGWGYFS